MAVSLREKDKYYGSNAITHLRLFAEIDSVAVHPPIDFSAQVKVMTENGVDVLLRGAVEKQEAIHL